MAYKIMEKGPIPYEILLDTPADLEELSQELCVPGSAALAVSTGAVYMVNPSGVWVEFAGEG